MMTFWMKTVNTEKAHESHISEILETLKKTGMIGGYSKLSFFKYELLRQSFVESFKRFPQIFKTFRN